MNDFSCEHPQHEGDRKVIVPTDQVVLTVDFMRSDGGERLARISPMVEKQVGPRQPGGVRLCRTCADRWAMSFRRGEAVVTPGDFSLLSEQQALV